MTERQQDEMPGSTGSYKQDALRLLAARKRPARPTQVLQDGIYAPTPDLRGEASNVGMREWLRVLGHSDTDLRALNVIHVAGTKGKGSTCAFTESLLRAHGQRTGYPRKTGMYTSPHLILLQERIRLNFQPLSETALASNVFETHNSIEHALQAGTISRNPRHLQMWAVIAFHTFIREHVDVAIVETNHGGQFDATNFIQQPIVTAVTTLGMDHVAQLGPTIANIAWHKAGIFKPGAAAITAPQAEEAAPVLVERAEERGVELVIADTASLPAAAIAHLPSDVLRTNCSVAVAAANAWLQAVRPGQRLSAEDISTGVANFSWPGRFQHLKHGDYHWYLDAAHNEMSMSKAAQWFGEATSEASTSASRLLLFSHMSTSRDGGALLRELLKALQEAKVAISGAVFTTYARSGVIVEPSDAEHYLVPDLWKTYTTILSEFYANAKVHTAFTVDEAVSCMQTLANSYAEPHILATGSQYLLGGVLQILEGS